MYLQHQTYTKKFSAVQPINQNSKKARKNTDTL